MVLATMLTTVDITPEEVKERLEALGLSQNALARGIRKDSGHVSRVLRRMDTSAVVLRRAQRWLEREELKRGGSNGPVPRQRHVPD